MSTTIEFDAAPDWAPLEKAVGLLHAPDFMYMGRLGAMQLYKHRWTRRYLNIDRDTGCCFQDSEEGYRPLEEAVAIAYVLGEEKERVWR